MSENGTPKKPTLSTNQRRALEALLSCPSVRAAARKVGLGERTLYRYLGNAVFRAELRKRQDSVLAATSAALCDLAEDATETMSKLLTSDTTSDAIKARLVDSVLVHLRKAAELDSLVERLDALEVAVAERG